MSLSAIRIAGLSAGLVLGLALGSASAQNSGIGQSSGTGGNPVLRDPGASTPQPLRAPPPPQTWSPGVVSPPAARSDDPYPNCLSSNCTRPPIIKRP